jgi:hypothetical protein
MTISQVNTSQSSHCDIELEDASLKMSVQDSFICDSKRVSFGTPQIRTPGVPVNASSTKGLRTPTLKKQLLTAGSPVVVLGMGLRELDLNSPYHKRGKMSFTPAKTVVPPAVGTLCEATNSTASLPEEVVDEFEMPKIEGNSFGETTSTLASKRKRVKLDTTSNSLLTL